MKKSLLLAFVIALIFTPQVSGQSFSSKMVKTKKIAFPKKTLPEDFKSYTINNSSGSYLSKEEIAAILDFQSFDYTDGGAQFVIQCNASDPMITKTLSKTTKDGKEGYSFSVKTTMALGVVVTNPDQTKSIYSAQYRLKNPAEVQTTAVAINTKPEDLNHEESQFVTEDKIGQFFTFSEDGKKFWMANSYQKRFLGIQLKRLLEVAKFDLQRKLDLRVDPDLRRYYVLNKIEEEAKSDELKLTLENIYENTNTLEDFLNLKGKLDELLAFNQAIINKYDASDKKQAKVIWASTYNQALLLNTLCQFDKAKEFSNKSITFKIRGAVSKDQFNNILNTKDGYNRTYDAQGNRKPVEVVYKNLKTVDATKGSAAPKNTKKEEVKIDKLAGHIINEKGEKELEGVIYIEFAGNRTKKELDLDTNTMVEVPSTDYGKKMVFVYDKKGKTKDKTIKAKDLYSFYVNDTKEYYEGFGTAKTAAEKLVGMASLSFGNHKFYLIKHDAGKVKLYEDKTEKFDGLILKLTKEEKGIKIPSDMGTKKFYSKMDDFYGKCKELKERIKQGEFSNTEEDHIKMADLYSSCVKK